MARTFTNPKTEEWMSASDLMTDKTFPMGNYRKILEKLTEMLPVMPKSIQTRKTSFGTDVICLHRDSREKFLSKIGFIEYQPKTSEWQSAFDLAHDATFPCNNFVTISKRLNELQYELSEFIQLRKPKTTSASLCLHKDGREIFIEKAGFNYLRKTEEWVSALDLANDPDFPSKSFKVIAKKLQELQSEMPDLIQMRRPRSGNPNLQLHKDSIELFMEKSGLIKYPSKTSRWQSASDLATDELFPLTSYAFISQKLKELQPQMPDLIQIRKSQSGVLLLCLHKDGRKEFLKRTGFGFYPPQTSEWQTAGELAEDNTFSMATESSIVKRLEELQSKMPELIQIRQPKKGKAKICLHRDGREEFLKRTGMHSLPKTNEWMSAVDLENYAHLNYRAVARCLAELQPQMPDFIQMRKPKNGTASLCLHKDKVEGFIKYMQNNKTIAMKKATKLASILAGLIKAKTTVKTKPDDTHTM